MKKPRKPKAKRATVSTSKVQPARARTPELGSAAQAFLRQHRAPSARSLTPSRRTAAPPTLGTAARAFLDRPAPARPQRVQAGAIVDSFEQRELVTLLLMPFILLAFALGMNQTWRHPVRVAEPVAVAPPPRPVVVEIAAPAMRLPSSAPSIDMPEVRLPAPALLLPVSPPEIVIAALELPPPRLALPATPPAIELPAIEIATPMLALPAIPPAIEATEVALATPLRLPQVPPPVDPPEIRLAVPLIELPRTPPAIAPTAPAVCLAAPGFGVHQTVARPVAPDESFGERLAAAARAQIGDLVIYNDKYQRIAYPMGDVAPMFGVCTDVIIRAYRALGVDLQQLVAEARIGSGDTSIQHRRTETLRRLFASRGESLAVTTFPENYQPGDIVTYHRPQNRHSRSHIAIVSDVMAPSGRPMIVHNRGWGPQLEDALFVDRITGHYRFQPAATSVAATATARRKIATPQTRPLQKAAYTPASRLP